MKGLVKKSLSWLLIVFFLTSLLFSGLALATPKGSKGHGHSGSSETTKTEPSTPQNDAGQGETVTGVNGEVNIPGDEHGTESPERNYGVLYVFLFLNIAALVLAGILKYSRRRAVA